MFFVETLALELGDDLAVGEHGNFRGPAQVLQLGLRLHELVDPFCVVSVVGSDMQYAAGAQTRGDEV